MLKKNKFPIPPFPGGKSYRDEIAIGTVKIYTGKIDPTTHCAAGGLPSLKFNYGPDHKNNTGWILCDGSPVYISLFPRLYQKIGFLYGKDGKDKFKVPDYQGYFLRGTDFEKNTDPDKEERYDVDNKKYKDVGSIQKHALRVHQHNYKVAIVATNSPSDKAAAYGNTSVETVEPLTPKEVISQHETRPVNIYVNYLIYAGKFIY